MRNSSKFDQQLNPAQRADAVTKAILRGLLDTLIAQLDGVRSNRGPEYLHDLRVATRRTRSALTQVKSVFPDVQVAHYRSRFAWLQQVTSPLRDLDVQLLDFDAYQQALPAPMRPRLEPLRTYLLAVQSEEQGRLAAILDSDDFTRLIRDWRSFLETPVPERAVVANGMRPVKAVADERIWRLVRRVRREGRAIRADSPPEALHELRKSCKKLRYLMEFFQTLYPDRDIRRLIRLLKKLLDNLGGFQDQAVQVSHLSDLARRMQNEGQADTETLLAMGVLVGHLLERQQATREAFAEVFASYLGDAHQARFRALFAPSH